CRPPRQPCWAGQVDGSRAIRLTEIMLCGHYLTLEIAASISTGRATQKERERESCTSKQHQSEQVRCRATFKLHQHRVDGRQGKLSARHSKSSQRAVKGPCRAEGHSGGKVTWWW